MWTQTLAGGVALVFIVLATGPGPGRAPAQDPIHARVAAHVKAEAADLIAFRRDLHRHPELSGAEERTSRVVAERLRALGLEVRTGIGGHGVIGILTGGKPGPMVAFRADMDAVPSNDPDPVDFRSETPGVRHICGHDVHVTVGIGLADALAAVRADVAGSVMFIFQPAEERATGARAMVEAGVFAREKPVAIYAVHTAPLEVGRLGVKSGVMMAARDRVGVTIAGDGDQGAAVAAARAVLTGVSTLGPDQVFTSAPEGFSVAQVGAGMRRGETTFLGASISVAGAAARARVKDQVARGLAAIAVPGTTITHDYGDGLNAAGVTNDPARTAAATAAIRAVMGDVVTAVETIPPAFSEDFGVFQAQVPGTFFYLGVSNAAKKTQGRPHAPDYLADEGAIEFGVRAMAAVLTCASGSSRSC
jgi:amidohydrolase